MNSKESFYSKKKEDSFLVSLFLSYCFSFQTRKDLILIKFTTMYQFDVFWELLENFQGNACNGNHY